MTTSLLPFTTLEADQIAALAAPALGTAVRGVEPLAGGRNSQVYRLTCEAGGPYVMKRYFAPSVERRRRMAVEQASLRFLWDQGVRNIPEPIAADPQEGWAICRYVEGESVPTSALRPEDVQDALGFVAVLKRLRPAAQGQSIGAASEACFSMREILDNLQARRERLLRVEGAGPAYEGLRRFLTEDFTRAQQALLAWGAARLGAAGLSVEAVLSPAARTLSPSDFGFHNALRHRDGRLVYLDFEYFGWDDPAKMLADFLLHPAMALPLPQGRQFAQGFWALFGEEAQLPLRTEIVYPFFGLKWCLILLNEFVPQELQRRDFAGACAGAPHELQMAQLAKAQHLLARLLKEYEHFPYRT